VQHTAAWNKPDPVHASALAGQTADVDAGAQFQQAVDHMQAGRWDAAIPLLETLTTTHEQLAGPWLNLGIAYTRSGAGDRARTALETATANNPRQAEAWNQLGMLHRRSGRFEQAATMYRRAIEVDPEHADAHWNLAVLHDRYLPDNAAAQHHLLRYQQLTGSDDPQITHWLTELDKRIAPTMTAGATGQ
jgi:Flp pilus assembly protein TadD